MWTLRSRLQLYEEHGVNMDMSRIAVNEDSPAVFLFPFIFSKIMAGRDNCKKSQIPCVFCLRYLEECLFLLLILY